MTTETETGLKKKKRAPKCCSIDPKPGERRTGLTTAVQAAKYLGVSKQVAHRMVEDGTLPHRLIGCHKRIPWVAIYKFAGEDE